ncbi:MAG: tetratricopeptide repeat protein [Methylophilaceae bacterium]
MAQQSASVPVSASNAMLQSMRVAWNFFHQGLVSEAEANCHAVLQLKPRHADALHLLGVLALQMGKAAEAVDLISKAIQQDIKNPVCYSNLGLAYHEQGQLPEAIKQYRRAIAIKPDYADAHYNLHAAVLDADDVKPAMVCLRRVLEINPRDIDARFMLGVLLDYTGYAAEAAACFAGIEQAPRVYQARLDAWEYLKSASTPLPPMMGSGIQTFTHAINLAVQDGLVLEFGVRFGTSIRVIAELVEQEVHGFDSFEGLPDVWHHEPKGSYTTKGVIPTVPGNVSLHVGWFEDTLPKFLSDHHGPVRFINIYCDIYSSTKTVLELLAARMVVGTVIVFDEYIGNEHWRQDEFKALQEAVAQHGWRYEYISFSVFTKQVAVRITGI